MDELNKWFEQQTSTPVGSLLLFLAVFLARVTLDRWGRRKQTKKPKRGKEIPHGG